MISVQNVSKTYNDGQSWVVRHVSLQIANGETLVILGSSGSGKTTILKMINRLVDPSEGHIILNDRDISDFSIQELRRSIGYVFQRIGLFPHMTIMRNIAIILELMGKSKRAQKARTDELLELVGLNANTFAKRYPDELSGGQQQRVGVARALAADPDCLLMDEPFGALDAIARDSLQEEMRRLNERLGKTIIFVTHDIFEAFRIADRIAVMHQGILQQVGSKNELLHQPQTAFVKELMDKHQLQSSDISTE